jgi:hypothetical protein
MKQLIGYVICDLDGCISDDRWRRDRLPADGCREPEAYDDYHRLCSGDAVNRDILARVLEKAFDQNCDQRSDILFVTSRPSRDWVLWATRVWIVEALKPLTVSFKLLYRPADSREASPLLKFRLVSEYFELRDPDGWAKIVAAFDDRQDVLDAYPIDPANKYLVTI